MKRKALQPGALVCAVALALCISVPTAGPACAGDRDTHLTATDFIARLIGLSEEEARIIALSDYAVDTSANTQPLFNDPPPRRAPVPLSPSGIATEATEYIAVEMMANRMQRDQLYHSLNKSADGALDQLDLLRRQVESASGEQQLYYMGQYLHALQDSFFHQHVEEKADGAAPYGPTIGHFKVLGHTGVTWTKGHEEDSVATHFDAAVRSFIATRATLIAFRQAREQGRPMSLPDGKRLAIYGLQGLGAAKVALEHGGDMVKLADAISRSYPIVRVGGVVMAGEPVPGEHELSRNLVKLWNDLRPSKKPGPEFEPITKVRGEPGVMKTDPAGLDFDGKDRDKLIPAVRNPVSRTPDGTLRTAAGGTPGGISLTGAAALDMPILIDIDSIRYDADSDTLVVAGQKAGAGQTFEAAIFLTALRLACLKTDPYFSLDPVDLEGSAADSMGALGELRKLSTTLALPAAKESLKTMPERSAAGVTFHGPAFLTIPLREANPAEYDRILKRYPRIKPKLVFRPDWLRETRLGKILYDADVVLKEVAEGVGALRPGEPAVARLPGYHSMGSGRAAESLLRALREQPAPGTESPPLTVEGTRLWFDLAGAGAPPAKSARAPDRQRTVPAPAPLVALADVLHRELLADKAMADTAAAPQPGARLLQTSKVTDLGDVVPRMYVRRHEKGVDLAGEDPEYNRTAADVNARFADYAARYPELRQLAQVFRAYVATRKIVDLSPGMCGGLSPAEFPLLPSERVLEPLPEVHPDVLLDLHIAAVDAKYVEGNQTWTVVQPGSLTVVSGGVSLGYEKIQASTVPSDSGEGKRLEAMIPPRGREDLMWQDSGRSGLALAIDRNPGPRTFIRVGEPDVVKEMDRQLDEVIKKLDVVDLQAQNAALKARLEALESTERTTTWGMIGAGIAAALAMALAIWTRLRRPAPVAAVPAAPSTVPTTNKSTGTGTGTGTGTSTGPTTAGAQAGGKEWYDDA